MTRFVPIIAFAGLVLALWFGMYREGRDSLRSTFLDQPSPAFEVPKFTSDTETLSLEDVTGGGPVVINFWASWCGPCIVEHPEITKLSKIDDVRVFGINYKDKTKDAQRFLKKYGDPFTSIGVDDKGRMGINFGVAALPETFILSGDGDSGLQAHGSNWGRAISRIR